MLMTGFWLALSWWRTTRCRCVDNLWGILLKCSHTRGLGASYVSHLCCFVVAIPSGDRMACLSAVFREKITYKRPYQRKSCRFSPKIGVLAS